MTILFKNSKYLCLNMYEKMTINIRDVEKIREKRMQQRNINHKNSYVKAYKIDVDFFTVLFKISKYLLLNMYEKIMMNIRKVEKIKKEEGNKGIEITRTVMLKL